ncbi:MAG TPA: UDP-N-acetylmuramoyl-L-alanyl-D-glutamate--2,6-diaminopimelate ligase [Solirubrobacteraceae bacterium]|jgi:UDP-N-acetylmuramoyl-L-alanyl-D-glutamate--2,6-diaminopimelate ligase|nr:UDP-N-acetylmuramoyl-L-alanyl-D-glutamate--2,6-diaminopimelate ligase [Solirubrobacteraceae bacterium]
MRLDELTAGLGSAAPGDLGAGAEVEITGLAYDSRAVRAGELFFCVSGFQSDGHEFAPQALASGAAALMVERRLELGVPEVLVDSARAAMAPLAARFYGEPTAELRVVGVTGTNGKTTTAYLLRALLEAAGVQCGLLGTVTSILGGQERPVARTTPEAIELQADFRAMLDGGDGACAIEVSSHALELGRTDATHFAAAIFTNLTQDHLDFHDTMEDYFLAKRKLFAEHRPGVSVLNLGDAYGRRLAEELQADADRRVVTFAAIEEQAAGADYAATELSCDFAGCSFVLRTPLGERAVRLPMPGRFNVANALAALAAAHALGVELDVLVGALEAGVHVPGRFEPVEEGQGFAVLVDYAHTPDSLENVLAAARELIESGGRSGARASGGRVLCVFGAGGDRDRGKRPLMGEIAARLADLTIVTSDNPRSEDPERIIAEIMAGVARATAGDDPGADVATAPRVRSIADRAVAIDAAIDAARMGDVLVIAGKGHEQGQEFAGGRKVPFDDVAVAHTALRLRGGRS